MWDPTLNMAMYDMFSM